MSRLITLLIVASFVIPLFAAAAETHYEWQTPVVNEGALSLRQQDGILVADYNLKPYQPILEGHYQHMVNDVDLLLKEPVALADNVTRIFFEASGLQLDARNYGQVFSLRPIIRDCEGELFYFIPSQNTMLKHKMYAWGSYSTAGFYSGEAGAASHGIYTTGDKVTNSRPDGKLELLGFRLRIAQSGYDKAKVKTFKGTICLGKISFTEDTVPFSYPYLYADSVLQKKGDYTFNCQVTDEFQGVPIAEFSKPVAFDPENPVSASRKLEFTLGADGFYWIRYQIVDATGAQVADGSMQHQVFHNPQPGTMHAVDLKTPPVVGYLRVNQGHTGRGVYRKDEPYRIDVAVFPKGNDNLKLVYRLYPFYQSNLLQEKTIDLNGKKERQLVLEFPRHERYTAFRLETELLRGEQSIDTQTYVFGQKTDPSDMLVRAGTLTDRRVIKKQPYNRFTYLPSDRENRRAFEFYADDFKAYIEQTHAFIQNHTYLVDLNDLSPLPGVFDFSQLDAVLETAADYGCKVTFRVAHGDTTTGPYRWGKFSHQFTSYGEEVAPGHYGVYAVTDKALNQFWFDSYRALFNRYHKHTAFQGYYIMQPAGEWVVVDQPWSGVAAGYSDASAESFRHYLQKDLSLDLKQLNRRWGTSYRSFDDVQPPRPTFRDGETPDLRRAWLDFCRFKTQLGTDFWIAGAVNDIRSYDDNNITICYSNPGGLKKLYNKIDYGHNGGNHVFKNRGEYVDGWKKGNIGWITEPHHPHQWAAQGYSPGKGGWVLDASVWNMLAQAGGGGANLHIYYYPLKNPIGAQYMLPHYGSSAAFDRFEKMKPILRELHDADPIMQTPQIAVNQDIDTLFCKHRTTFSARLADLGRWKDLVEQDGLPYAQLSAFSGEKFKLIIPNILDEVISEETLSQYEKAVKVDGSCMIIAANTGKFVPERGTEPFQLLKAFGITAPTREYSTNGEVTATALADNPLFDNGHAIAFQTLSRMREQLHSPEIRSSFWDYAYRWIPETNYFGYYPGQEPNGTVLATFSDGGAAMSLHTVGKGKVLVFWGTPDISAGRLDGMMRKAAQWAGVTGNVKDGDIPTAFEMTNPAMKRHYGLFYVEQKFGTFTARFPTCPDGDFFCDELIQGRRLGRIDGKTLRETGIPLTWQLGDSPLRVVRIVEAKIIPPKWVDSYNQK